MVKHKKLPILSIVILALTLPAGISADSSSLIIVDPQVLIDANYKGDSEYRFRAVVFCSIYSTLCHSQDIPGFIELQNKFGEGVSSSDPNRISVSLVFLDFGTKRVNLYLDQYWPDLPLPVTFDFEKKVARHFKSGFVPSAVFIDKTGRVKYHHVGMWDLQGGSLEEFVRRILSQPDPVNPKHDIYQPVHKEP